MSRGTSRGTFEFFPFTLYVVHVFFINWTFAHMGATIGGGKKDFLKGPHENLGQ